MGLFDIFKKKESVNINIPIVESSKETTNKVVENEKTIITSDAFNSFIIIKGLRDDFQDYEMVDFVEHDEISDEAKELTKTYIKSIVGEVFYSHKKFYKLQESPFKCKDKNKTQVWLYNLIDYELLNVRLTYDGKELVKIRCDAKPELNTTDKEKLEVIAKDIKSN